MDRFFSRYVALCVLSLFMGIQYKAGVVLRPFDALIGMGGLLLVGRASVRGSIDALKKPAAYYLFVVTYSYRCLNAIFLSGAGTVLKETLQVIEFVLLAHLIAASTRTEEGRRIFFRTLLVGSGIMALLTVIWHVSNGHYAGYKELGDSKYIFSLFALFALGKYLRSESERYIIGVLLGATILTVLSGERKGWLALIGGGGAMYFVFLGGTVRHLLSILFRPRFVLGGIVALVSVIAVALQFEYVIQQVETIGDVYVLLLNFDLQMDLSAFETSGSNLARLYILIFTIQTVMSHPWFGVGTGRWHEALAKAAYSDKSSYMIGAHSEYQRFAVENGFTGLGLYVLAWGVAVRDAFQRYYRRARATEERVLEVVGVSLFGVLINLFLGGGALNIVFMALAVGLLVGLENDDRIPDQSATASEYQ